MKQFSQRVHNPHKLICERRPPATAVYTAASEPQLG